MTMLSGKVALVTGAAGGFGQSLTKQLLEAGSRLVLADLDEQVLRERSTLTLKSAGIEHLAGNVMGYVAADLSTPDGPQRLFEACQAVASQVDILINNAGMAM